MSPTDREPHLILEGVGTFSRAQLLPDGEAVIFRSGASNVAPEERTLLVVEIESGVVTDLGGSNVNNPRYISTGHIVYGHVDDQALMAVPFDLSTHRVTGEPRRVLPEVLVYGGGATQFEVSETGTAFYSLPPDDAGAPAQLVSVDASGVATTLPVGGAVFEHPRFSPTGRQIAYEGLSDIFVYDLESGENRLLVPGEQDHPLWSRDGRFVYFSQNALGVWRDGYRRLADGSGEAEQIYGRDAQNSPLSMSLDGTQILVMENTQDRGYDLVIMSEDGDSTIFTDYLRADWNETMATISPDGTRAAYVSDQSGVPEVYVSSFPDAGDRVPVSNGGGGTEPVWAPDGSAIYYRNGSSVMRASIPPGAVFSVDTPQEIFEGAWTHDPGASPRTNWDVHPDGESFLFVSQPGAELIEGSGSPPVMRIELVVNFFEELRQRMGN